MCQLANISITVDCYRSLRVVISVEVRDAMTTVTSVMKIITPSSCFGSILLLKILFRFEFILDGFPGLELKWKSCPIWNLKLCVKGL